MSIRTDQVCVSLSFTIQALLIVTNERLTGLLWRCCCNSHLVLILTCIIKVALRIVARLKVVTNVQPIFMLEKFVFTISRVEITEDTALRHDILVGRNDTLIARAIDVSQHGHHLHPCILRLYYAPILD